MSRRWYKRESLAVEARRHEVERLLAGDTDAPILLHPNMVDRYRREIQNLLSARHDEKHRHEAVESVRALIKCVVLTPDVDGPGMTVSLYGDLAGILQIARGRDDLPGREPDLREIQLVVGLGDPRATRRRVQGKMVGPAGLDFLPNNQLPYNYLAECRRDDVMHL